VLGFFLEVALGDQEREVRVLVTGGLEAVVEIPLHALPDLEPVWPDRERAPNRAVVRHLRHAYELQVPLARVLALLRKLFDRLGHDAAPLWMKARGKEV
jgi:hypothetical protein